MFFKSAIVARKLVLQKAPAASRGLLFVASTTYIVSFYDIFLI